METVNGQRAGLGLASERQRGKVQMALGQLGFGGHLLAIMGGVQGIDLEDHGRYRQDIREPDGAMGI